MALEMDYLAISSLAISLVAASISLIRFKTESRVQRQAGTVTMLYDLVKLIDNDRAVEARGILRENGELNRLREVGSGNLPIIPELDDKTQEAARYVATTYDRLGFILRHDPGLEKEILDWNGDVIADMWIITRPLIKDRWRMRNPRYAMEFERLAEKALAQGKPS